MLAYAYMCMRVYGHIKKWKIKYNKKTFAQSFLQ